MGNVFRETYMTRVKASFYVAAFAAFLIIGLPRSADAELRVDITQGTVKPMPIAVTDLVGETSDET